MKRKPSPRKPSPRTGAACRSKYLGESLRLRGREATVVGCARPKARPAPAKPTPRFQVKYNGASARRPVPRAAVYRAARCAAKPEVRGCKPFDPSTAPFVTPRPARAGRRLVLRDRTGAARFVLAFAGGLDMHVALHPLRGAVPGPAVDQGALRDVLARLRRAHPELALPSVEAARAAFSAALGAPARTERVYDAPAHSAPAAPAERPALALPAPRPRTPELPLPPRPGARRTPELPLPPRPGARKRIPEADGVAWESPIRQHDPPIDPRSPASRALIARCLPETRPLVEAVAHFAPWAWTALAKKLGRVWGRNARTDEPMTLDERCAAYGEDGYRSYYDKSPRRCRDLNLFDAPSEIERTQHFGIDFHVRPGVEPFIAQVAQVIFAIEFAEWAHVAGVRKRLPDGTWSLRRLAPPEEMVFPPGQAGATNAMHRRNRAKQIASDRMWFDTVPARIAQGEAIVAAWRANGVPTFADFYALPPEHSYTREREVNRTEFQHAWSFQGEDWRLRIYRGGERGRYEDGEIHVDVWRRGSWRRRYVARWDFLRDRIPLDDAPEDARKAIEAAKSRGMYRLSSIFGGGFGARRRSVEDHFVQGKPIAEDPFVDTCGESAPEMRLAMQLASRRRCLVGSAIDWREKREIEERLERAHGIARRAVCPDPANPDDPSCARYYELLAAGCADNCSPREELDACPKQILPTQIAAWAESPYDMPSFVFDSDKPHRVGSTPNCYFSGEMQQRLRLHAEVMERLHVPLDVQQRGEGAERAWITAQLRAAEQASFPKDAAQYERNDERILGRARRIAELRTPVTGRGGDTHLANAVRLYDILVQEGDSGAQAFGGSLIKALGLSPDAGPTEIEEAVTEAYADTIAMHTQDNAKRSKRVDAFRKKVVANLQRRSAFVKELVATIKRQGLA